MYKIGDIEGNPVLRDERIKDKHVKEYITDEQIVKLIAESESYKTARDKHVMDNLFEIVTWDAWRDVSGIKFNTMLVRVFSVGYNSDFNRETGNWDGRVEIEEDSFHTRFEVKFLDSFEELPNYYNSTLSSFGDKYFPTSGDNQEELDKRVTDMIYRVREKTIPAYIKHIDSEINKLREMKVKCRELFRLRDD